MVLSESLSKPTEQANNLKSGFQPVLRQRKAAAPGTSVFTTTALADNHEPLAPHPDTPVHPLVPNSSSVASAKGVKILIPPVTPISILAHLVSRHSAADFPLPFPVDPSTPMPHDDSQQSFQLPEPSPHLHDRELDGLNPDHTPFVVLDADDLQYDPYRGNLYHKKSAKLSKLVETIIADPQGRTKLLGCMRPHNWNLEEESDTTPFLTVILEAAAQTERAELENIGKSPEKMCRVVTQQLKYQSSERLELLWLHDQVLEVASFDFLSDIRSGIVKNQATPTSHRALSLGVSSLIDVGRYCHRGGVWVKQVGYDLAQGLA
ncbi:hypothetical protein B0H11DRAFT_1905793 [Mycena galericulata]|nr:hypothetical protein B0H11DRAFT_1905793 [Mycena galericulata]